jgi:F-type H+-transporting ATPase subunit delta
MKNHLLAERYARALRELLQDNELEAAAEALRSFSDLYEARHDLRSVLANPSLAIKKRLTVLEQVLAKMTMPAKVAGLIQVLLRRGRIALVADVTGSFEVQVDQRLGRVGAIATTAIPMPEEARTTLKEGLARFSGKDVRMAYKVDPDVVGGVIVRLDGLLLDGSLRTRLKRLADSVLSQDIEAD